LLDLFTAPARSAAFVPRLGGVLASAGAGLRHVTGSIVGGDAA
jgi:hypothetical protein